MTLLNEVSRFHEQWKAFQTSSESFPREAFTHRHHATSQKTWILRGIPSGNHHENYTIRSEALSCEYGSRTLPTFHHTAFTTARHINLTGGSWIHPQSWKTTTFTIYALILSFHVCLHRTTVMSFNIFIPPCVLHIPSIISLYVTIIINQQWIKIKNFIITLVVPLTCS
jgi:hypothetical protein